MNTTKKISYKQTIVDHSLRALYGLRLDEYVFLDYIRESNAAGKDVFEYSDFITNAGLSNYDDILKCFRVCKQLELIEFNGKVIHTTELWNRHFMGIVPDVIKYLNGVTGSSYKDNSKAAVKFIKARIKEGYSIDDFKKVIDSRNNEWGQDEQMRQYLRPETLFGTKFESYLQFANMNMIQKKQNSNSRMNGMVM